MCVGSVCTHPPYNDKNPPSVFFLFFIIHINLDPFLKSSHSQILGCVTSHRPRPLPRLLIDTTVNTLDPPWVSCHPSAIVSTPEQVSPKWLRCYVVGCNNEQDVIVFYYLVSWHKLTWVHFLARREKRTNKYISLQFPKEMNTRGSKTKTPFIHFHTNLQSFD